METVTKVSELLWELTKLLFFIVLGIILAPILLIFLLLYNKEHGKADEETEGVRR